MQHLYFNSPLGVLKLSEAKGFITAVSFMETSKGNIISNEALSENQQASAILLNCEAQLTAYFSGSNLNFNIPLAQPGTAFQQKVWNELLKIGAGKTQSYMQLSKRLGDVKAIRAVGTANGRNNIAIIVPCHRVIGSDGSLVGYAGDLWRKKWLIEHEARYVNGLQTLF